MSADAYTIDNSSGKSVIKFTGSGSVNTAWAAGWRLDSAPSSAVALDATSATMELYGVRSSSIQEGFGSVNVVSGTGDLTGVVLIGGYNSINENGPAKNIDTDIWTYVTGGISEGLSAAACPMLGVIVLTPEISQAMFIRK